MTGQRPPRTIVIWSDIACPWSHLAVHRLHEARHALGLDEAVTFEHRSFPLELVNERPTPYGVLAAEIPVVGALDPTAGWQMWQGGSGTWPVSSLLALEAVHAARQQSAKAAEQIDRALRRALFGESRCITLRHVVLDVAAQCWAVDADALAHALDTGVARATVIRDWRESADGDAVKGSPHLFLPDGSDHANPGVQMHWEGEEGKGGFPVVDADDPDVYKDLVTRAAS